MSTISLKLKPWTTPNYATIDMPPRPRQEGLVELPSVHITDLSAEELNGLAQQWLTALYAKAGKTCNWTFITPSDQS